MLGDRVGSVTTAGTTLLPERGSPAEHMLETREHNVDITIVSRVSPTGTPWDRASMIPIEAVWVIHDDQHERETKRVPAIVVKPQHDGRAPVAREVSGPKCVAVSRPK